MEEVYQESETRRARTGVWNGLLGFVEALMDFTMENVRVIVRERELFLGTGLALIGFLSFESDKFCDGNTADYLSCTRPSTFYYFDALDITLIVIGVFLVMLWFLRRR